MSKKLKNYPDPLLIVDKYGADSLRAYLLSSPVIQAENLNFSEKGVEEALRKNIMLINNIYNFYQMYSSSLVENDFSEYKNSTNVLDLWILIKINRLIKEVESAMLSYSLNRAMRPITEFIDEFSTWYLRRSRDRLKGDDNLDKNRALSTMRFVFLNLSKIMAPFMPFISEDLWQKISGYNFSDSEKSVHLEAWPSFTENDNEEEKMEAMSEVRKIVELGLSERDNAGIKVRQILNKAIVLAKDLKIVNQKDYLDLIIEEVNVKSVEVKEGAEELKVEIDTEITPELKLEGGKRELIRFINLMRKDLNLSIGDLAITLIESDGVFVKNIIETFFEDIKKETLSSDLKMGLIEGDLIIKEFKIDGEIVKISLK
jgi:isoleucyl-tRNA synthetase